MNDLKCLPDDSTHDYTAYRADQTAHSQPAVDSILGREGLTVRIVEQLLEKARARERWPELYDRAFSLLECLPLSTSDYSIAKTRLRNSLRYASDSEHGAAAFELRMLHNHLRQCSCSPR